MSPPPNAPRTVCQSHPLLRPPYEKQAPPTRSPRPPPGPAPPATTPFTKRDGTSRCPSQETLDRPPPASHTGGFERPTPGVTPASPPDPADACCPGRSKLYRHARLPAALRAFGPCSGRAGENSDRSGTRQDSMAPATHGRATCQQKSAWPVFASSSCFPEPLSQAHAT